MRAAKESIRFGSHDPGIWGYAGLCGVVVVCAVWEDRNCRVLSGAMLCDEVLDRYDRGGDLQVWRDGMGNWDCE